MTSAERDAILFHLLFGLIAGALFVAGWPQVLGARVWLLIALYNIALPLTALARGHGIWLNIWWFVFPLSVLQVLPDWFLSAELGGLVFPDIGAPMIGSVSSFMALMWVTPLFIVVLVALAVEDRANRHQAAAAAGLTALIVFALSEAISWRIPLWYAQDVWMLGHVALYVLVPEFLLGVYAYLGFALARRRAYPLQLGAAMSVMLLYAGSLSISYLLIETL